jgi:AcrR family transcriptional regulator
MRRSRSAKSNSERVKPSERVKSSEHARSAQTRKAVRTGTAVRVDKSVPQRAPDHKADDPVRSRVMGAAFSAFMERGYEGASTLEIATRAKVSKRELYALFASKQAMLGACIAERTKSMRLPVELTAPQDVDALVGTLRAFGSAVLRVICHPAALAVHRLAIAEADRSPEIASMLDAAGREANYRELSQLLANAQARDLIGVGDPHVMAEQFLALLAGGGLLPRLLLRLIEPPAPAEIERRVEAATQALLALYGKTRPSGKR